jgi:hypothetical protein
MFMMGAIVLLTMISFFSSVHHLFYHESHYLHHHHSQHQGTNSLYRSLEDFKSGLSSKNRELETTSSFSIDEPEDPLPNPTTTLTDGNSTFSACLLVMDDNHRLVEWLAYHYHVLPLRTLIVAVDPRSRTRPTKLLNRYRRLQDQSMYIEEWTDFDFMKPELAKNKIQDDAELQIKRDRHRMRQKNFYRACLQKMKTLERSWVTLIDTDEFIMYNHKSGGVNGDESIFQEWETQQATIHKERYHRAKPRTPLSKPPPSPAEAGGLMKFLHQEQAAGHEFFQSPCISMPRLQFGAKESTPDELRDHGIDSDVVVNPDQLDTLRYRKHAERQDFVKNGLAKSMMDVSRITTFPRIQSLHRPIKEYCSAPWKNEWDSGLRINHYLGSWEAYSFRDDSRRGGERSYEGWVFKAMDADETDDNIRPWVAGFVESQGKEQAQQLLDGAGLPKGYQSNGKNWTIMFLDEILGMNETKGNDARVQFDTFVRDFHLKNNQSIEGIL